MMFFHSSLDRIPVIPRLPEAAQENKCPSCALHLRRSFQLPYADCHPTLHLALANDLSSMGSKFTRLPNDNWHLNANVHQTVHLST